MKKLTILICFFLISTVSVGEEACNVHEARLVSLFSGEELSLLDVKVQGGDCYKSDLHILISHAGKVLYKYNAPFKKHTAISWESLSKEDVKNYINSIYGKYNFITCKEIFPEFLDETNGYNYNTLKVSSKEYDDFRNSDCRAFLHNIHYEATRVIVFSDPKSEGVVVSEYGL